MASTTPPDLLSAAKALLALELDREGGAADPADVFSALMTLRAAVLAVEAARVDEPPAAAPRAPIAGIKLRR